MVWPSRRSLESGTVKHDQRERAVLLRGHGSKRLPAEALLPLVSVVVVGCGELARPARQEVIKRR